MYQSPQQPGQWPPTTQPPPQQQPPQGSPPNWASQPPNGQYTTPRPQQQIPPITQAVPPQGPAMATMQPPHPDQYRALPPPNHMYAPPYPHPQMPYPPAQPAPRQRTAIACRYCRRRKIRCSGFDQAEDGRCTNCVRFSQECVFTPVSAQTQAFVPAHTVWRGHNPPPNTQLYGAYGQPLPQGGREQPYPPQQQQQGQYPPPPQGYQQPEQGETDGAAAAVATSTPMTDGHVGVPPNSTKKNGVDAGVQVNIIGDERVPTSKEQDS